MQEPQSLVATSEAKKRPRCRVHRDEQRGLGTENWLVACVPGSLYRFHYLREVVARRCLHRRKRLECLEPVKPKLLADGQHVPVVLVGRRGSGERTSEAHGRFSGG
jgi:hypothetical protein